MMEEEGNVAVGGPDEASISVALQEAAETFVTEASIASDVIAPMPTQGTGTTMSATLAASPSSSVGASFVPSAPSPVIFPGPVAGAANLSGPPGIPTTIGAYSGPGGTVGGPGDGGVGGPRVTTGSHDIVGVGGPAATQRGSGIGGPPPPPTTGFIPSHDVVSSTPPNKFHNPQPTSLPEPAPLPQVFTPASIPPSDAPIATAPIATVATTTQSPGVASLESAQDMSISVDARSSGAVEPSTPTRVSGGHGGLFGWFQGGTIVNKMLEKTKSSVDYMITTLDPGMKEVIRSGGDVTVLVTSTKEVKVGSVRQAFQEVFGRATVHGVESQADIAPQPVGYASGLKGAEERIEKYRQKSAELNDDGLAFVSVENFIVELMPDRWFDIGCVVLRDRVRGIALETYTQATPIPPHYIQTAQDRTPADYGLRWSGLAVTIGQVISETTPGVESSDWHRVFTGGVSRGDMIYLAAKALAGMYKLRLSQESLL